MKVSFSIISFLSAAFKPSCSSLTIAPSSQRSLLFLKRVLLTLVLCSVVSFYFLPFYPHHDLATMIRRESASPPTMATSVSERSQTSPSVKQVDQSPFVVLASALPSHSSGAVRSPLLDGNDWNSDTVEARRGRGLSEYPQRENYDESGNLLLSSKPTSQSKKKQQQRRGMRSSSSSSSSDASSASSYSATLSAEALAEYQATIDALKFQHDHPHRRGESIAGGGGGGIGVATDGGVALPPLHPMIVEREGKRWVVRERKNKRRQKKRRQDMKGDGEAMTEEALATTTTTSSPSSFFARTPLEKALSEALFGGTNKQKKKSRKRFQPQDADDRIISHKEEEGEQQQLHDLDDDFEINDIPSYTSVLSSSTDRSARESDSIMEALASSSTADGEREISDAEGGGGEGGDMDGESSSPVSSSSPLAAWARRLMPAHVTNRIAMLQQEYDAASAAAGKKQAADQKTKADGENDDALVNRGFQQADSGNMPLGNITSFTSAVDPFAAFTDGDRSLLAVKALQRFVRVSKVIDGLEAKNRTTAKGPFFATTNNSSTQNVEEVKAANLFNALLSSYNATEDDRVRRSRGRVRGMRPLQRTVNPRKLKIKSYVIPSHPWYTCAHAGQITYYHMEMGYRYLCQSYDVADDVTIKRITEEFTVLAEQWLQRILLVKESEPFEPLRVDRSLGRCEDYIPFIPKEHTSGIFSSGSSNSAPGGGPTEYRFASTYSSPTSGGVFATNTAKPVSNPSYRGRNGGGSAANVDDDQPDMILYVTYRFDVVSANVCQFHSKSGRPTVINLNIGPRLVNSDFGYDPGVFYDRYEDMMRHFYLASTLLSAIAFNRNFAGTMDPTIFVRQNVNFSADFSSNGGGGTQKNQGNPLNLLPSSAYRNQSEVLATKQRPEAYSIALWASREVREWAMHHYQCFDYRLDDADDKIFNNTLPSSVAGAPLGLEARYTAVDQYAYYSDRTLSEMMLSWYFTDLSMGNETYVLFASTGWYDIDWANIPQMRYPNFGAGAGCDFLNKKCNQQRYLVAVPIDSPEEYLKPNLTIPDSHYEIHFKNVSSLTKAPTRPASPAVVDPNDKSTLGLTLGLLAGTKYSNISILQNSFCFPPAVTRCHVNRRMLGNCQTREGLSLPTAMRYFPDSPTKGGAFASLDYCPIPYDWARYCASTTPDAQLLDDDNFCFDSVERVTYDVTFGGDSLFGPLGNNTRPRVSPNISVLGLNGFRQSGLPRCFRVVECDPYTFSYKSVAFNETSRRWDDAGYCYDVSQFRGTYENPKTFVYNNAIYGCSAYETVCALNFQESTHLMPPTQLPDNPTVQFSVIEDIVSDDFDVLSFDFDPFPLPYYEVPARTGDEPSNYDPDAVAAKIKAQLHKLYWGSLTLEGIADGLRSSTDAETQVTTTVMEDSRANLMQWLKRGGHSLGVRYVRFNASSSSSIVEPTASSYCNNSSSNYDYVSPTADGLFTSSSPFSYGEGSAADAVTYANTALQVTLTNLSYSVSFSLPRESTIRYGALLTLQMPVNSKLYCSEFLPNFDDYLLSGSFNHSNPAVNFSYSLPFAVSLRNRSASYSTRCGNMSLFEGDDENGSTTTTTTTGRRRSRASQMECSELIGIVVPRMEASAAKTITSARFRCDYRTGRIQQQQQPNGLKTNGGDSSSSGSPFLSSSSLLDDLDSFSGDPGTFPLIALYSLFTANNAFNYSSGLYDDLVTESVKNATMEGLERMMKNQRRGGGGSADENDDDLIPSLLQPPIIAGLPAFYDKIGDSSSSTATLPPTVIRSNNATASAFLFAVDQVASRYNINFGSDDLGPFIQWAHHAPLFHQLRAMTMSNNSNHCGFLLNPADIPEIPADLFPTAAPSEATTSTTTSAPATTTTRVQTTTTSRSTTTTTAPPTTTTTTRAPPDYSISPEEQQRQQFMSFAYGLSTVGSRMADFFEAVATAKAGESFEVAAILNKSYPPNTVSESSRADLRRQYRMAAELDVPRSFATDRFRVDLSAMDDPSTGATNATLKFTLLLINGGAMRRPTRTIVLSKSGGSGSSVASRISTSYTNNTVEAPPPPINAGAISFYVDFPFLLKKNASHYLNVSATAPFMVPSGTTPGGPPANTPLTIPADFNANLINADSRFSSAYVPFFEQGQLNDLVTATQQPRVDRLAALFPDSIFGQSSAAAKDNNARFQDLMPPSYLVSGEKDEAIGYDCVNFSSSSTSPSSPPIPVMTNLAIDVYYFDNYLGSGKAHVWRDIGLASPTVIGTANSINAYGPMLYFKLRGPIACYGGVEFKLRGFSYKRAVPNAPQPTSKHASTSPQSLNDNSFIPVAVPMGYVGMVWGPPNSTNSSSNGVNGSGSTSSSLSPPSSYLFESGLPTARHPRLFAANATATAHESLLPNNPVSYLEPHYYNPAPSSRTRVSSRGSPYSLEEGGGEEDYENAQLSLGSGGDPQGVPPMGQPFYLNGGGFIHGVAADGGKLPLKYAAALVGGGTNSASFVSDQGAWTTTKFTAFQVTNMTSPIRLFPAVQLKDRNPSSNRLFFSLNSMAGADGTDIYMDVSMPLLDDVRKKSGGGMWDTGVGGGYGSFNQNNAAANGNVIGNGIFSGNDADTIRFGRQSARSRMAWWFTTNSTDVVKPENLHPSASSSPLSLLGLTRESIRSGLGLLAPTIGQTAAPSIMNSSIPSNATMAASAISAFYSSSTPFVNSTIFPGSGAVGVYGGIRSGDKFIFDWVTDVFRWDQMLLHEGSRAIEVKVLGCPEEAIAVDAHAVWGHQRIEITVRRVSLPRKSGGSEQMTSPPPTFIYEDALSGILTRAMTGDALERPSSDEEMSPSDSQEEDNAVVCRPPNGRIGFYLKGFRYGAQRIGMNFRYISRQWVKQEVPTKSVLSAVMRHAADKAKKQSPLANSSSSSLLRSGVIAAKLKGNETLTRLVFAPTTVATVSFPIADATGLYSWIAISTTDFANCNGRGRRVSDLIGTGAGSNGASRTPCRCFAGYGGERCDVCAYISMNSTDFRDSTRRLSETYQSPLMGSCKMACDTAVPWALQCKRWRGILNPSDNCLCYCNGTVCLRPVDTITKTVAITASKTVVVTKTVNPLETTTTTLTTSQTTTATATGTNTGTTTPSNSAQSASTSASGALTDTVMPSYTTMLTVTATGTNTAVPQPTPSWYPTNSMDPSQTITTSNPTPSSSGGGPSPTGSGNGSSTTITSSGPSPTSSNTRYPTQTATVTITATPSTTRSDGVTNTISTNCFVLIVNNPRAGGYLRRKAEGTMVGDGPSEQRYYAYERSLYGPLKPEKNNYDEFIFSKFWADFVQKVVAPMTVNPRNYTYNGDSATPRAKYPPPSSYYSSSAMNGDNDNNDESGASVPQYLLNVFEAALANPTTKPNPVAVFTTCLTSQRYCLKQYYDFVGIPEVDWTTSPWSVSSTSEKFLPYSMQFENQWDIPTDPNVNTTQENAIIYLKFTNFSSAEDANLVGELLTNMTRYARYKPSSSNSGGGGGGGGSSAIPDVFNVKNPVKEVLNMPIFSKYVQPMFVVKPKNSSSSSGSTCFPPFQPPAAGDSITMTASRTMTPPHRYEDLILTMRLHAMGHRMAKIFVRDMEIKTSLLYLWQPSMKPTGGITPAVIGSLLVDSVGVPLRPTSVPLVVGDLYNGLVLELRLPVDGGASFRGCPAAVPEASSSMWKSNETRRLHVSTNDEENRKILATTKVSALPSNSLLKETKTVFDQLLKSARSPAKIADLRCTSRRVPVTLTHATKQGVTVTSQQTVMGLEVLLEPMNLSPQVVSGRRFGFLKLFPFERCAVPDVSEMNAVRIGGVYSNLPFSSSSASDESEGVADDDGEDSFLYKSACPSDTFWREIIVSTQVAHGLQRVRLSSSELSTFGQLTDPVGANLDPTAGLRGIVKETSGEAFVFRGAVGYLVLLAETTSRRSQSHGVLGRATMYGVTTGNSGVTNPATSLPKTYTDAFGFNMAWRLPSQMASRQYALAEKIYTMLSAVNSRTNRMGEDERIRLTIAASISVGYADAMRQYVFNNPTLSAQWSTSATPSSFLINPFHYTAPTIAEVVASEHGRALLVGVRSDKNDGSYSSLLSGSFSSSSSSVERRINTEEGSSRGPLLLSGQSFAVTSAAFTSLLHRDISNELIPSENLLPADNADFYYKRYVNKSLRGDGEDELLMDEDDKDGSVFASPTLMSTVSYVHTIISAVSVAIAIPFAPWLALFDLQLLPMIAQYSLKSNFRVDGGGGDDYSSSYSDGLGFGGGSGGSGADTFCTSSLPGNAQADTYNNYAEYYQKANALYAQYLQQTRMRLGLIPLTANALLPSTQFDRTVIRSFAQLQERIQVELGGVGGGVVARSSSTADDNDHSGETVADPPPSPLLLLDAQGFSPSESIFRQLLPSYATGYICDPSIVLFPSPDVATHDLLRVGGRGSPIGSSDDPNSEKTVLRNTFFSLDMYSGSSSNSKTLTPPPSYASATNLPPAANGPFESSSASPAYASTALPVGVKKRVTVTDRTIGDDEANRFFVGRWTALFGVVAVFFVIVILFSAAVLLACATVRSAAVRGALQPRIVSVFMVLVLLFICVSGPYYGGSLIALHYQSSSNGGGGSDNNNAFMLRNSYANPRSAHALVQRAQFIDDPADMPSLSDVLSGNAGETRVVETTAAASSSAMFRLSIPFGDLDDSFASRGSTTASVALLAVFTCLVFALGIAMVVVCCGGWARAKQHVHRLADYSHLVNVTHAVAGGGAMCCWSDVLTAGGGRRSYYTLAAAAFVHSGGGGVVTADYLGKNNHDGDGGDSTAFAHLCLLDTLDDGERTALLRAGLVTSFDMYLRPSPSTTATTKNSGVRIRIEDGEEEDEENGYARGGNEDDELNQQRDVDYRSFLIAKAKRRRLDQLLSFGDGRQNRQQMGVDAAAEEEEEEEMTAVRMSQSTAYSSSSLPVPASRSHRGRVLTVPSRGNDSGEAEDLDLDDDVEMTNHSTTNRNNASRGGGGGGEYLHPSVARFQRLSAIAASTMNGRVGGGGAAAYSPRQSQPLDSQPRNLSSDYYDSSRRPLGITANSPHYYNNNNNNASASGGRGRDVNNNVIDSDLDLVLIDGGGDHHRNNNPRRSSSSSARRHASSSWRQYTVGEILKRLIARVYLALTPAALLPSGQWRNIGFHNAAHCDRLTTAAAEMMVVASSSSAHTAAHQPTGGRVVRGAFAGNGADVHHHQQHHRIPLAANFHARRDKAWLAAVTRRRQGGVRSNGNESNNKEKKNKQQPIDERYNECASDCRCQYDCSYRSLLRFFNSAIESVRDASLLFRWYRYECVAIHHDLLVESTQRTLSVAIALSAASSAASASAAALSASASPSLRGGHDTRDRDHRNQRHHNGSHRQYNLPSQTESSFPSSRGNPRAPQSPAADGSMTMMPMAQQRRPSSEDFLSARLSSSDEDDRHNHRNSLSSSSSSSFFNDSFDDIAPTAMSAGPTSVPRPRPPPIPLGMLAATDPSSSSPPMHIEGHHREEQQPSASSARRPLPPPLLLLRKWFTKSNLLPFTDDNNKLRRRRPAARMLLLLNRNSGTTTQHEAGHHAQSQPSLRRSQTLPTVEGALSVMHRHYRAVIPTLVLVLRNASVSFVLGLGGRYNVCNDSFDLNKSHRFTNDVVILVLVVVILCVSSGYFLWTRPYTNPWLLVANVASSVIAAIVFVLLSLTDQAMTNPDDYFVISSTASDETRQEILSGSGSTTFFLIQFLDSSYRYSPDTTRSLAVAAMAFILLYDIIVGLIAVPMLALVTSFIHPYLLQPIEDALAAEEGSRKRALFEYAVERRAEEESRLEQLVVATRMKQATASKRRRRGTRREGEAQHQHDDHQNYQQQQQHRRAIDSAANGSAVLHVPLLVDDDGGSSNNFGLGGGGVAAGVSPSASAYIPPIAPAAPPPLPLRGGGSTTTTSQQTASPITPPPSSSSAAVAVAVAAPPPPPPPLPPHHRRYMSQEDLDHIAYAVDRIAMDNSDDMVEMLAMGIDPTAMRVERREDVRLRLRRRGGGGSDAASFGGGGSHNSPLHATESAAVTTTTASNGGGSSNRNPPATHRGGVREREEDGIADDLDLDLGGVSDGRNATAPTRSNHHHHHHHQPRPLSFGPSSSSATGANDDDGPPPPSVYAASSPQQQPLAAAAATTNASSSHQGALSQPSVAAPSHAVASRSVGGNGNGHAENLLFDDD